MFGEVEIMITKLVVATMLFLIGISVVVIFAYGQDAVDPAGYCDLQYYPYTALCDQQRINMIMDELMNTSKRFDCYQNDSSERAEYCFAPEALCFANQTLADRYVKEFGNDSTHQIPCPALPKQPQQDESGK
jgi:hypothetical protein